MEPTDNHLSQTQDHTVTKRLSQLRNSFDQYRQSKLDNNKTDDSEPNLQKALIKAAKAGNINLMIEFISHGANPFICDENNLDAISYAMEADAIKTGNMLLELIKGTMQSDEGGR